MTSCIFVDVCQPFRGLCHRHHRHHHRHHHPIIYQGTRRHFPEDNMLHSRSLDKVHPRTGHEGPEGEWRYSSSLSATAALDRVSGQTEAPAVLPPGMTWFALYRRLDGIQGRSGRVLKSGIRVPDRPSPSELLYQLHYPFP